MGDLAGVRVVSVTVHVGVVGEVFLCCVHAIVAVVGPDVAVRRLVANYGEAWIVEVVAEVVMVRVVSVWVWASEWRWGLVSVVETVVASHQKVGRDAMVEGVRIAWCFVVEGERDFVEPIVIVAEKDARLVDEAWMEGRWKVAECPFGQAMGIEEDAC